MKILVTTGSTTAPIDKVRTISNIFKGKTGTYIANYFAQTHEVTLITSNDSLDRENISHIHEYKTFWELYYTMENLIKNNHYDVIIHSAAVSDYEVETILQQTSMPLAFRILQKLFNFHSLVNLLSVDRSKKISSSHTTLYIKMKQTPKIVDQIRPWGFTGKLIKFKLQVDMTDDELIQVAEQSRIHSNADAIVANCLEWSHEKAYIIRDKNILVTNRDKLPQNLKSFMETYL